jgi:hypothetical protein
MNDLFRGTLPAAAMAGALVLSLACCPAIAQAAATAAPASCATPDRASALKPVPTGQTLWDIAIAVAGEQQNNLSLANVSRLEGPCADQVYAFRMGQIFFEDGAVPDAGPGDRTAWSPNGKGLTNWSGEPLSADHPELGQARFVMAVNVDRANIANEKRSLDVGVWKTSDGYLLAAFIRQQGSFSTPLELARSGRPIKSVTFFPAPDANSGRLGLVQDTGAGIALVSLDWHHAALSNTLRSAK